MSAGAFDRAPLGSEVDTDLIAEGVRDLAEELRAIAEAAHSPRAGLADRVLAALDVELAERTPVIAPPAPVPFLSRLTLSLRPASFRSLLAAAALVAVLGASVAFAAAGGLPFHLPEVWAPEQAAPVQSDTQQPTDPADEETQGPADADEDSSPDPSEDVDEDQDEDSDEDSDEDNSDEDSDEDNSDEDSDEDEDADEDDESDGGDEDDESDGGDQDSDEDSTSGEDESDGDGDSDDDDSSSDDSAQDDSGDASTSEED